MMLGSGARGAWGPFARLPVLAAALMITGWLAAWPRPARADADYPFKVESVRQLNDYKLIATNEGAAPIDLNMTLTSSENLGSDATWPIRRVIPPHRTVEVTRLYGIDPARAYRFNYRSDWLFGDPQARHDDRVNYRLPFADGLTLVIGQAPGSPAGTHTLPDAKYAVDIPMPLNTPIVAARAGYVIENVRPYEAGKPSSEFADKANFVRILHDDGTWAIYVHLTKYSATLYPGMHVDAGTVIGLSGTSGYSSGPHLHFAVQKNADGRIVSLPFHFYNTARGPFDPAPDLSATADYRVKRGDGMAAAPKPPEKRSMRECMGSRTVIDEGVVACMKGER